MVRVDEVTARQQWSLLLGLTLVLLALALWAIRHYWRVVEARLEVAHIAALPVPAAEGVNSVRPSDPAQLLAAMPSTRKVASIVDIATREAGASLMRINLTENDATTRQLARMDVELVIKGPYSAIKRVLIDVLARLPSATVRRLILQGSESAPEAQGNTNLQATISLVVWGPPLAESAR